MTILAISLSDPHTSESEVKKSLAAALRSWTSGSVLPDALPSITRTIRILVDAKQSTTLKDAAKRLRISPDELASRLAHLQKRYTHQAPQSDFSDILHAMNLRAYDEQIQCAENFEQTTNTASIGLVEAATGLGKTNVTAHRALRNALENRGRTVIAVPSVQIAHQTIAAIHQMQSCWAASKKVTTQILLGRQEFVCVEAIQAFLNESHCTWTDDVKAAVRNWIESGGKGMSDAYPMWTIAGLENAVASLAASEFHVHPAHRLDNTSHCNHASPAHQAQFQAEADISVVTHMMLGRDIATLNARSRKSLSTKLPISISGETPTAKSQKTRPEWRRSITLENAARLASLETKEGKLPEWSNLIIDEAHLLRANITLATSTDISILHLLRQLEVLSSVSKRAVSSETLRSVRTILNTVRACATETGTQSPDYDDSPIEGFEQTLEQLRDAIPDLTASDVPEHLADTLWSVQRIKSSLNYALKTKSSGNTKISWSPIKQLPSIVVQPTETSLTQLLDMLWQYAGSTVILSATLTTPSANGATFGYLRQLLALDGHPNVNEFRPITGNWLYEPVTLHMPSRNNTNLLPTKDADDSEWITAVTRQILKAAKSSSQGILILSGSRKTTHALRSSLETHNCRNPLIDSNSAHLPRALRQFTRNDHSLPPIWIAHGPAWTGLDIPGTKLDCLIIPRLPFKPPLTTRTKGPNWTIRFLNQEMSIRLRQGIGRLVRQRQTDTPKHLWILDPRVHHQMTRSLLAGYKNRMAIMPN